MNNKTLSVTIYGTAILCAVFSALTIYRRALHAAPADAADVGIRNLSASRVIDIPTTVWELSRLFAVSQAGAFILSTVNGGTANIIRIDLNTSSTTKLENVSRDALGLS